MKMEEKNDRIVFDSRPRQMGRSVLEARKKEMNRREAVLDAEIIAGAKRSKVGISGTFRGRRRLFGQLGA